MDPRSFLLKKGYKVLQKVGQGTYASVFKAVRQRDGYTVAIKAISVSKLTAKQTESTLNEIRIICSVSHPNIVEYHDAFVDEANKDLYVIMEFLGGGDLSDNIEYMQKSNGKFSEKQIWGYVLQILQGLAELHKRGVIHRDVKPANLFLSADKKRLKIGDMNTSKILQNDSMTQTVIGTPYYLAPEIWLNAKYDYRCDVFSLGCVVYELAMLRPPFRAANVQELFKNVLKGYFAPLTKEYGRDLNDFIKVCLIGNIKKRPSALKLLQTDVVRQQLRSLPELDFRKKTPKARNLVWSQIKIPRTVQEMTEVLNDYRSMSQDFGIQRRCLSELRSKNRFRVKTRRNLRSKNSMKSDSVRSAVTSLNNSRCSSRRYAPGFKKKFKMIPSRKPPTKRRPPKKNKLEPSKPKNFEKNYHSKRSVLNPKKKKKISRKAGKSDKGPIHSSGHGKQIPKSDSRSGLNKNSSNNLYSELKVKKDRMKQTLSKQSLHHPTKPVAKGCPPFAVPPKILSQGFIKVNGVSHTNKHNTNKDSQIGSDEMKRNKGFDFETNESEGFQRFSSDENEKMTSSISKKVNPVSRVNSNLGSNKKLGKERVQKLSKRKLRSVPELSVNRDPQQQKSYYNQSKKRRKDSKRKDSGGSRSGKRNKSAKVDRMTSQRFSGKKPSLPNTSTQKVKNKVRKRLPPQKPVRSNKQNPQTKRDQKEYKIGIKQSLNVSSLKNVSSEIGPMTKPGMLDVRPGSRNHKPRVRIFGTIYEDSKDFSKSGQNDSSDMQNRLKKTRSTQIKSITDSVGLKSKEIHLSRAPRDRGDWSSRHSRSQPKKLYPIGGSKKSKTPKGKLSRFGNGSQIDAEGGVKAVGAKRFEERFGVKGDRVKSRGGYKRRYTVGSRGVINL